MLMDFSYTIDYPKYLGAFWDATTTNLTFQIPPPSNISGPLNLTISFLSPITPDSTLRQSIPASYITIHAHGGFNVDVYMDINGGWASGNDGSKIKWDMTINRMLGLRAWAIEKESQERFTEYNDRGEWGKLYFTAPGVGDCIFVTDSYLTISRTPTSRVARLRYFDSILQKLAHCSTRLIVSSEQYKSRSRSSPSTNLSNSVVSPIDIQAV